MRHHARLAKLERQHAAQEQAEQPVTIRTYYCTWGKEGEILTQTPGKVYTVLPRKAAGRDAWHEQMYEHQQWKAEQERQHDEG